MSNDATAPRGPRPGDLCVLLGDYKAQHYGCDEHPDGTVTDVRTGRVISDGGL